jgi:hypothetical protein
MLNYDDLVLCRERTSQVRPVNAPKNSVIIFSHTKSITYKHKCKKIRGAKRRRPTTFTGSLYSNADYPVRIRVRIDPRHPLVCRKRRLNGTVLRMRPEKPRSRVTAGVAR